MKQRIIIILALLSIVLMLNACQLYKNLDKSVVEVPENDDIVLIGFKPRYRFSMKIGHIKDDKYVYEPNRVTSGNIYPDEGGYIITRLEKTEPNQRYGITQVLPEGISLGSPRLKPCDGRGTYTFSTEGGRVIYLGDLEYTVQGNGLKVSYSNNYEKAKEYIRKNYPAFTDKLQQGKLIPMEVINLPCIERGEMYLIIPTY